MRLVESALPLDVPMVPLLLSEKQYHQMTDRGLNEEGRDVVCYPDILSQTRDCTCGGDDERGSRARSPCRNNLGIALQSSHACKREAKRETSLYSVNAIKIC